MAYSIIIILNNSIFINILRFSVNIGNPNPCLLRWPEPQAFFFVFWHALLEKRHVFVIFYVFLLIFGQHWSIFVRTYLLYGTAYYRTYIRIWNTIQYRNIPIRDSPPPHPLAMPGLPQMRLGRGGPWGAVGEWGQLAFTAKRMRRVDREILHWTAEIINRQNSIEFFVINGLSNNNNT